jgi:hypothetical protein
MDSVTDGLETFWENLLSSDPERIQRAWGALSAAEAASVRAHLQEMTQGPGWQAVQQHAADGALRTIGGLPQAKA